MKPLYQELPFTVDNYINFYREDLPYFIVPWHYHPEVEIMCIEKGIGTRFVEDHIEGYSEGDVCMMGPQLPHEWRNDKEYQDTALGLRAICHCVYFRIELFSGVMIRLPEMARIRELIERSRRGIKFVGESREKIASYIRQTFNREGVERVTNLLTLLDMMATTEEYELLASVGLRNRLIRPTSKGSIKYISFWCVISISPSNWKRLRLLPGSLLRLSAGILKSGLKRHLSSILMICV